MAFPVTDPTPSWSTILRISGPSRLGLVGVDLFVGDVAGPRRRVDPEDPVGLLPCLERPRDAVLAEIRRRESQLGHDPGTLCDLVPLAALPATAVGTRMDHWTRLALEWLAVSPGDAATDALLDEVERAPWATQRTRHRARALRAGR